MKLRLMLSLVFVTGLAIAVQLLLPTGHASALAYNYTTYPMDDSTFRASFTMSASDIQSFLQSRGSGLANYSDIEDCGPTSGSHYTYYAQHYSCGTSQLASKIIYDAAQTYGINPQVILATLQKEQSLVTTPNPSASQLTYAMGYGCPDSGTCSYPGFFNQVDNGTWQFRLDFSRLTGDTSWWNTTTGYPCGGQTRYYSQGLIPNNNVTFADDYGNAYITFVIPNASTATLYCYTPHVFPGSSQQYYSGNYWFVYYFSQWFGATTTPYAFKSASSGVVYLFVNGFKVGVPSMAVLQDYGINPAAIQTLSQSAVDSIPVPSLSANGISPNLSSLVKSTADNRIFLITVGKKYTFTSMQQFYGFSFDTANITYLPLGFIASINGSGYLENYLQNPHNSVFQINAGNKRIIFDYPTYAALNPSGAYTPVSDSIANSIPSGLPLTSREVLVKINTGTVFLLANGNYYGLPSMDIYNCWGFGTALGTPLYPLVYDSDIAPITNPANLTSCIVNNSQGTTYLLNNANKYAMPAGYGSFGGTMAPNADLLGLVSRVPSVAAPLGQAVKSNAPVVWYLENGVKKSVPSLSTLGQLGIATSQISSVSDSALSSITASGIKLADGQAVKSDSGAGVFMVSGNSRVAFPSGDDFMAYHFPWTDVVTVPQAVLDQYYPYNGTAVEKYIYNFSNGTVYLADHYGCYALTSSQLTSFGQTTTNVINHQNYSGALYRYLNLSQCQPASTYAVDANTGTVYWIDNGTRHAFSSWNALVTKSGSTTPNVISLSDSTLSTLSVGSAI